jgi:ATP-binding cassette subfamily B protein
MGRAGASWNQLRRRITDSRRLLVVRLLADASKPLTVGFGIDLLATAILPNVVIVAMGSMVGRIPAAVRDGLGSPSGHSLVVWFVIVAVTFSLSMLTSPLHAALASATKVRLTYALQSRLIKAVSDPVGISHLEDPAVLDQLTMAQGSLMNFWPADAPATLVQVWSYRLIWIAGCVVLASFRWWLGASQLLLWPLVRRPLMRVIEEHVQAFGGNVNIMRRADYFQQLSSRPPAAKEIRIFGLARWIVERFRTTWVAGMAEVWKIRAGMYKVMTRVGVIILVVYLGSCAYVAWAAVHGTATLRDVAIVLPVLGLTMLYGTVTFEDITLEWMASFLPYITQTERELAARRAELIGSGDPSGLPRHEVRFEGVRFTYPGGDREVFSGLDLAIAANRSTAIVGANGAGKTTLVKLLARLHEPTAGRIAVDGTDVASLEADAWQRRIAVVFQDFARYPLAASDNIGLGAIEHARDTQGIETAAERAGARSFIEALPSSWATTLSREFTGGADLSGGQWQRVALARALFAVRHGASILVLDEPTSWMDVRGEAAFFERFLEITAGLTTIIISHRFSTVRLSDDICVLDEGRLVEQGTHDELLEANGRYARMFTLQASRFVDAEQDTSR